MEEEDVHKNLIILIESPYIHSLPKVKVVPKSLRHCFFFLVNVECLVKGFKVSRMLYANMILFINIGNYFKQKIIFIMTLSVAHWDT